MDTSPSPRHPSHLAAPPGPQPKSSTIRYGGKTLVGTVAAAGIAGSLVFTPSSPLHASTAEPEIATEIIEGTYLSLTSISVPSLMRNLSPGAVAHWDVGIVSDAPEDEPGTVRAGISAQGELPLEVTVYSCSEPWTDQPSAPSSADESCAAGAQLLTEHNEVSRDGETEWLSEFSTDEEQWLRLEVVVPADLSNDFQSMRTSIQVHAAAEGDAVSAPPPGEDPDPGEDPEPEDTPETTPSPPSSPEASQGDGAPAEGSPEDTQQPADEDLATTGFSSLWLALLAIAGIVGGGLLALWAKRRSEVKS